MAKKKNRDADELMEDMDSISEESDQVWDTTAYVPFFNKKRGAYDMLTVRIDSTTKKSFVETEEMRYDSEARALQDLMKRYSQDFITKTKKRK